MSDIEPAETGPTLDNPCPTEILLGTERGMWPIQAFTADSHAASWLADDRTGYRRQVFRARLVDIQEVELGPAPPARGLQPRTEPQP